MKTPLARGPVTSALIDVLALAPAEAAEALEHLEAQVRTAVAATADLLRDDDLQLALFCLNEIPHLGLEGVDERWEWDPRLIAVRSLVERHFEEVLRERVPVPTLPEPTAGAVAETLFALAADDSGPSMSRYIAKRATAEQLREFLAFRSIYQLAEADPHSWAIARLSGRAKVALVEIQADEYGGGRPEHMHATLYARAMRGLGLDDRYGAYVDHVPAIVLASSNLMSLFALHRRLRGAIVGHLAAYEMTSSIPSRRYGNGFRRLGHGPEITRYFDEHIEADAVHEQIAARDLAGGLVEDEPGVLADVLFGAAAYLTVDAWMSEEILASWDAGGTCLREPLLVVAA
ncbi:iron-containing redox enzyme family protein [Georgenia sp. MJ206]|uniref:iron-containing redox enzyme family protein n=1 Tax=Georgenia wangjunii TaxID=3117730 RepID=UPI002F268861